MSCKRDEAAINERWKTLKPQVSIIVPVYKAEKYIDRCVCSILAQSVQNIELIIVNDGSPDNSLAIAEKYARQDSRVKVLSQKNMGVGAARNTGIKAAEGKYFGFVDADDWIEPNMLERLISFMEKDDCELGVCGHYKDPIKMRHVQISPSARVLEREEIKRHILPALAYGTGNIICNCVWNKLYSAELVQRAEAVFPISLVKAEDLEFNRIILPEVKRLVILPDLLYHYCVSDNSLTRTAIKDYHLVYLDNRDRALRYLRRHSLNTPEALQMIDQMTCKDVMVDLKYICSPQCNKNPRNSWRAIKRMRENAEIAKAVCSEGAKELSGVEAFIINSLRARKYFLAFLYGMGFGWLLSPLKKNVRKFIAFIMSKKFPLSGEK
jgi:glycosyltransferase involved in cell wall biosynthesis